MFAPWITSNLKISNFFDRKAEYKGVRSLSDASIFAPCLIKARAISYCELSIACISGVPNSSIRSMFTPACNKANTTVR